MRCNRSQPSNDNSLSFWNGDVWLAQVNRLQRWQRKAAPRLFCKSRQDERGWITNHRTFELREQLRSEDRHPQINLVDLVLHLDFGKQCWPFDHLVLPDVRKEKGFPA